MLLASTGPALTKGGTLRIVGFLVAAMLFFVITLLISFFLMIWFINRDGISPTDGPNFFMIGLIPPSIAAIFLYAKVFGKHLTPRIRGSASADT